MQSLLVASLSSLFFGLFGVSWDSVDRKIEREFPEISMISTVELAERINSDAKPLIVDVRRPDEFAVSHLPAAINLETAANIAAQTPDKTREIVVYCSVGYRSAGVADELQRLGYSHVRNLRHSVFAWANESRPLVNAAGGTQAVHPFNRIWGKLVKRELHRYPD